MMARSFGALHRAAAEMLPLIKMVAVMWWKAQRNHGNFKQIEITRETYRMHRTYLYNRITSMCPLHSDILSYMK